MIHHCRCYKCKCQTCKLHCNKGLVLQIYRQTASLSLSPVKVILALYSVYTAMQSIFRQLPKLCSSLMCAGASSTLESLPRSSTLTLESLPRRGKREFATLQLWNSDEGLEGGTAHLDIKHLVKNWRMDNTGGYSSSQLRERLRGFQGENIKETDSVANTLINSHSNLCTFCAGIILFLLCDHIVVNFCRFNCPIQRLFMKYMTSHSSFHFCPTIMVN